FLGLLLTLAMLGQFVLAVVGQGFWLSAPTRFGARGLACGLMAISVVVVIRLGGFATLFESIGSAGGRGRGGPGGGRGEEELFSPLVLILVEAARLALIAATTQAIGRNLRRSNPPTAGAGLLAILSPCVILGAFLITILIGMFSEDKTLES